MKHSRISLIERAAQAYGFDAGLRAPAPAPAAPEAPKRASARPEAAAAARVPPPAPFMDEAPEPFAAPEPEPVREAARVPVEPQPKARVQAPEPESEPEPEPVLEPEPLAAPEPFFSREPAPTLELAERFVPRRHDVAPVDRARLEEAGFVVPDAPVTGLAEEFRLVKRQLLASIARRVSLPEEKRRSVLITSAQSGDGKTFCAVNMALSLAGERDLEVLLVDADFPKPGVLPILGVEPGPGLVDALSDPEADPEEFVIRTDVKGLSVLPSGARANNVPELLASARTRELLARLVAADRRRIILFDSPPALVASPSTVLAGHVGQVLIVVRADQTTEADLRETIGLLSGCDHVGLILNAAGVAVTGRKFGSYEGYGHDQ